MSPSAISAGILMYRRAADGWQVLLAHPGGPFFMKKDEGAWTIPKGAPDPDESLEAAARREFREETGLPVRDPLISLGEIRQKGGKVVHAWGCVGDGPDDFVPASNQFELEWPPRSGRRQSFPEIDRAAFFAFPIARTKIMAAQMPLLDRLLDILAGRS